MSCARVTRILFAGVFAVGFAAPNLCAQATQDPQAAPPHQPTAAELSHNERLAPP